MLYERWCRIAEERRNEIALHDLASGRRWSFGELRDAGEARAIGTDSFVFPQGHSPEFILDLLAAWQLGRVVCPLEPGQSPPQVPMPPHPCVHLKTTSATTGSPRLVAFTAAQLAADAENIVATMGLRPEWPNLGVISMAHSYGFSNLVLPLLLHGIPLLLVPSHLPEIVRRAASEQTAVTIAAVPVLWRTWHEAEATPRSARLAISAGAPLPLGLEQAVLTRSGLKIHNFYGSTECGGIAYDSSETARAEEGLTGRPMKNVSLSVGDDGCLIVQGSNVAESYWPLPDEGLRDGCYRTRDLAEIRDEWVVLRGRAGDVINVAGRKVSPETVEQVLLQHPAVRNCLAFGVPSQESDRVEEIVACLETWREAEPAELRQFLLARIPAWQVPRAWWFLDSLAPNARGKISRSEWREKYLRGGSHPLLEDESD